MMEDKENIKKMLREGLIKEALIDIDIDVDWIYNNYFREAIEKIESTGLVSIYMFKSKIITSGVLKSKSCVLANEKNPVMIYLNDFRLNGNFYNPIKNIISIQPNINAINHVNKFENNLIKASKNLSLEDGAWAKRLINEFKETKIKGSIHHELVHWIDDTLRVGRIKKAAEYSNMHNTTTDKKGVKRNLQAMEIEAIMHNLYQLKKAYSDVWDELTFDELVNMSPALMAANDKDELTKDEKKKWRRLVRTRMHREGLLGKNMGL